MTVRRFARVFVGVALLAAAACAGNSTKEGSKGSGDSNNGAEAEAKDIGPLLYAPTEPKAADKPSKGRPVDWIEVSDCRLAIIEKVDVSSQREGILLAVATEIKPGEQVPKDRLIEIIVDGKKKQLKKLHDGNDVAKGDLLAQLDDRLARAELKTKVAKLGVANAERDTSKAMKAEMYQRWDTRKELLKKGAAAPEEVREAKLGYDKYTQEEIAKGEAIKVAEAEFDQAKTIVEMHEIRSTVDGKIKQIYRQAGESIKGSPSFEPIMQIQRLSKLKAAGLVDEQHAYMLKPKMRAVIEMAEPKPPVMTWYGHQQEITGVAVARGKQQPLIVSACEGGTIRVWEYGNPSELRILENGSPVKSLACSPPGSSGNLCLSGGGDGVARLWDLDRPDEQPAHQLKEQHTAPITCVAFSPDGNWCATGSEDLRICIWNTQTGDLKYRLPAGHRDKVTSVQFTPLSELVSAGRDQTIRLWKLGEQGAHLLNFFAKRSGDVTRPGVNPDGTKVFLDQGRTLRILSLPKGLHQGVIQNSSGGSNFSTFALFSPDARLAVTAGAGDGIVQVWRTSSDRSRASEIQHLVSAEQSPVTCAEFAPDGSFLVTGTRDSKVMLWRMPSAEESAKELVGEISLVEKGVEASNRQVRIWADLDNPDERLLPGTTVTMVIYPEK